MDKRRKRRISPSGVLMDNHRAIKLSNTGRNSVARNTKRKAVESEKRPSKKTKADFDVQKKNRNSAQKKGFKFFDNLTKQDSETVVMNLLKNGSDFKETLNTEISSDLTIVIVKLLRIVMECNFVESKLSLLHLIFETQFVDKLMNYVSRLAVQDERDKHSNKYFWTDVEGFWRNLLSFSKCVCELTISLACENLPKLIKTVLIHLPYFEIAGAIKPEFEILNTIIVDALNRNSSQKTAKASSSAPLPPDDFHDINIYPDVLEVTTNHRPFLRENIVVGPFESVEQYLDIQFRLLREDFVSPLRDGIVNYLQQKDKRGHLQSIKIYKNVQFISNEIVSEYNCYKIKLNCTNKSRVFNFENSKRFMFGSLLCFTKDNFQTILFGKVVQRDEELLRNGEILVGFTDNNTDICFESRYILVESSVYFEPYFHVLTVLKAMNPANFPMKKYIINVDSKQTFPQYLQPQHKYKIYGQEISPYDWQNKQLHTFNDSQNKAFKAALTQEFSIIQGPPGTGKTFLALEIAKTLINNSEIWYKNTPILVICFTNHALDQFLEGLLDTTNSIIRVGGRSKNESLKNFNLRFGKRFQRNVFISQQNQKVNNCIFQIQQTEKFLQAIYKFDGVLNFYHFINNPAYTTSWFNKRNIDIDRWLFGGRNKFTIKTTRRPAKNTTNQVQTNDLKETEIEEGEIIDENEYIDEDLLFTHEVSDVLFVETIPDLKKSLEEISHNLNNLDRRYDEMEYLNEKQLYNFLKNKFNYLERRLQEGKTAFSSGKKFELPTHINLEAPHNLSADDRWCIYFYFLQEYIDRLTNRKQKQIKAFKDSYKVFNEMRDFEDVQTMKTVKVVGMTTTGAARLRSSLQTLKSPIVIVEEAAEVLEAHIITSITEHCKHLILIGDHQQLQPSSADFRIKNKFKLGISLFERMIKNNIQCYTLNVQHRMRPEISSLIAPTIYPDLTNHSSVNKRPNVRGMESNLFFVDHNRPESVCQDESKKNVHEAKFLIHFCRYLILNGYKGEQITILVAYLGQFFEMQKEKKSHCNLLKNVRIAVLDNYQGEESDIILLSLVRNNENDGIGFLRNENRVCVALSRAKNGLYIMGNMSLLCKNSELWKKVKLTLDNQNAIGFQLKLKCAVHTDKITSVSSAEDFQQLSEGGCKELCNATLICGHFCTSLCHVRERNHEHYRCMSICNKKLCTNEGHPICTKKCFEACNPCNVKIERELNCGHVVFLECHIDPDNYLCKEIVPTVLFCGHEAKKPCHRDPETFKCQVKCEIRIEPCGHACKYNCHIKKDPDHLEYICKKPCARYPEDCTSKTEDSHICKKQCFEECGSCEIEVAKTRQSCTHVIKAACHVNIDNIKCRELCKRVMECRHKCRNLCHEPCGPCRYEVKKTVPDCNHKITIACSEPPTKEKCSGAKCPRKISCGHDCTKKCSKPCTLQTECKALVDCNLQSPCGHTVKKLPCKLSNTGITDGDKVLLKYCREPCGTVLKCTHPCSGTCGLCNQGRFHIRCTAKCGAPQICGHICKLPCREACKPCQEKCLYKCVHSRCGKSCGLPCTMCKEECPRSCKHGKCNKWCEALCSIQPCLKPCKKKLECKHGCIGFCGDPCPPLCRICDADEVKSIFFGNEDQEDARFVLLVDCKHVLEHTGMETWLNQELDEIKIKQCPRCKVPIINTPRYFNYIKRTFREIIKVKRIITGTDEDNFKEKMALRYKINEFITKNRSTSTDHLLKMANQLHDRLLCVKNGKRQKITKQEINDTSIKFKIIKDIQDATSKTTLLGNVEKTEKITNLVEFIVKPLTLTVDQISKQEIMDVDNELNRLHRLIQLLNIEASPTYVQFRNTNDLKIVALFNRADELINTMFKFDSEFDSNAKAALDELTKDIKTTITITDRERKEIVAAMNKVEGAKLGRWFRCRNGHPYFIGGCGGAMQEAKCFCGAAIGGRNHALRQDNALAPEMDGARHAAWSERANMANYQF